MWYIIQSWLHKKRLAKLKAQKAAVNKCCPLPCQDPICKKIGCLNQDGFALRNRIRLLVLRLERVVGNTAEIPNNKKHSDTSNIVDLNKYRNDK